jgi:hypothetical protein
MTWRTLLMRKLSSVMTHKLTGRMAIPHPRIDNPPVLRGVRIDLFAVEPWTDLAGRDFDVQQVGLRIGDVTLG